jgi:uncharacterized membrane protein YkoI
MSKWMRYGAAGMIALSLVAAGCRGKKEEDSDAAAEAQEQQAPATAVVPAPTPDQGVAITEETPGLTAKAKIQPEQARQIALTKIPNGTVTKGELEEEDGKLIYSFDIKVPGAEGITELHVDALTGDIIKTEHESDAQLQAEKAKEKGK